MSTPVIVDTNIVVSGLLSTEQDSPLTTIVDEMLGGTIPFLLSPQLLAEYRAVLLRPKIARRHQLTEKEIDAILIELTANAIWREPIASCSAPDPGDDHLWALMSSAPGSILITGDQMLQQNPPPFASILSPSSYFALKNKDML